MAEPQAVMLASGRELADHLRARHLKGRDVLSGRSVGDEGVDLVGLEYLLDHVERLVDLRGRRRLDLASDEGQARRPDLVAVDVGLELSGRVLGGDRRMLQGAQSLPYIVVAGREGARRSALRRVGDLVDIEV